MEGLAPLPAPLYMPSVLNSTHHDRQLGHKQRLPHRMGYTGPGSPENWASLSPDRAACANGKQQSPIDITGYRVSDLGPISFSFAAIEAILRNDCRQIHVDYAPGNTSVLGGREYSLKSAHLHSPSEHLVDGHSFAAELHMVHADSGGNLAVVGLLFTLGAPSSVVQSILDAAPPPRPEPRPTPRSPSPPPFPLTSPTTATTAPRPLPPATSPSTGTSSANPRLCLRK